MRLAFISDIHGNIHALRAVWQALQDHHIDQIICLGDLVGYGAGPAEVIEFLETKRVKTVLGSSDARVAFDFTDRFEKREGVAETTLEWTKTVLGPEHRKFLRALPTNGRIETPQGRLRYCHGSPHDPEARLDLHGDEEMLNAVLSELHCEILVCGGTHIPYLRRTSRGLLVDPGSVGFSLNGEPGADIAVFDITSGGTRVSMIKVPYDYHAAAFDVMAWNLPSVIASVIRTGKP
ncbi:putative phosphoesterase [Deinobacterium chartae]|uniref:Phosphoesterase n=1 Tax=Deinobacterium chartae TaxID=521158 RepID=A0A841HXS9_9DEIO|nr:metallophosphoesterase family protein [Deinobacterium chartae]MBB6096728.1 putative phosphoesterase [Deinobacterium chartae]